MHLVYMDDSRDNRYCVFSALAISASEWQNAFRQVRDFRRDLKNSDGIYVYKEFHATDFVAGRGNIADRVVPKGRRCALFGETLELIARLPGIRLFNAVFPHGKDEQAFEWLLNRINRTMHTWDSNAILICDEGKELVYTRLRRRMGTYNPIPSNQGIWDNGNITRNIPLDKIIEDPFFKNSAQSYFIQLVDFCAFSLLRRENPTANAIRYGLNNAFNLLSGILVSEACSYDPEGIIRPR